MVHVSVESSAETRRRLLGVLRCARVTSCGETFAFREVPLDHPPVLSGECVAAVRGRSSWSLLVPAAPDSAGERFGLLRIEFPADADNSGFVGWLASHLKLALGTGVFVVCGYDSAAGGVFDYWGFPASLHERVLRTIAALRRDRDDGNKAP